MGVYTVITEAGRARKADASDTYERAVTDALDNSGFTALVAALRAGAQEQRDAAMALPT